MIGKQTKGTSFSGCVCYVLKEEKSKLLEAVGVDGTPEQMAEHFKKMLADIPAPTMALDGCGGEVMTNTCRLMKWVSYYEMD